MAGAGGHNYEDELVVVVVMRMTLRIMFMVLSSWHKFTRFT